MRAGRNLRTLAIVIIMAAVGLITSASAQSLRTVSYQGQLKNGSTPMNGTVLLTISYYHVGANTPLATETFPEVPVTDGVFGILLGSRLGGFPETFDFSQPIEIGVSVNNATELPRTLLTAVPYALAAHTLDGIPVSATPQNDRIFPIPLDANGHISSTLLPPTATTSINGIPAVNNDLHLSAGQNVTLTPDYTNNQLVISTALGSVTSVTVGAGLIGGGNNGAVSVGLDVGQIPGYWLSPASITGRQLNRAIAGPGLIMDVNGNLGLSVDPANFTVVSDVLHLRQDVPVIGTTGTFGMLTATDDVVLGSGEGNAVTVNARLDVNDIINVGHNKILNVATPTDWADAVNKAYVDSVRSWLAPGQIFVGNVANLAQGRDMIGDARINEHGEVSVVGLQGNIVAGITPQNGDFLQFEAGEGSAWVPKPLMLPAGHIFIGDEGGVARPMSISGDATVDYNGEVTIHRAQDFTGNLEGDVTGTQSATLVTALRGTPIEAAELSNGDFLRYDVEMNAWVPTSVSFGQVNSISGGPGIHVNSSDAQNPVVSVIPPSQMGMTGSVSLSNGSSEPVEQVQATVYNSSVTSNSIIMLTVVLDGHSVATDHYVPYITGITEGSFDIHLHEASANLPGGRGATIQYIIFN